MFDLAKKKLFSGWPSKKSKIEANSAIAATLELRIAKLNAGKQPPSEFSERTIETREAERFLPRLTSTYLTAKTGKKFDARIINVSRLGVAVDADFSRVDADTITMVGTRRVNRGRPIMSGTVFMFEAPLDEQSCGPHLVL